MFGSTSYEIEGTSSGTACTEDWECTELTEYCDILDSTEGTCRELNVHSEYFLHIAYAVDTIDSLWDASKTFVTYSESISSEMPLLDEYIIDYEYHK
jgi:hypothetical protein